MAQRSQIRDSLRSALAVSNKWTQFLEESTGRYWPNIKHHQWTMGKLAGWMGCA